MSVRRSLIMLTIVALGLPFIAFSSRASQLATQNPPRSIQLYEVHRGDVTQSISATGRVNAETNATLSFTVPGRVVEILVNEGDFVQAGEPIIKLDNEAQLLAYQQSELALEMAYLALDDLLDGVDEDQVKIAEANLTAAWGSYNAIANAVSDDELRAAQLRVEQAQAAHTAANQARSVANSDSEEQIALLDASVGEAAFNVQLAQLQLQQMQNGSQPQLNAAYARVVQAQKNLDQVMAGPTDTEIQRAEVQVEQAIADLEQAQDTLNKYELVAPIDGVIASINAELGSLIMPSAPVVMMTQIDPLLVLVQVDEIDIRHISQGMPVTIRLDALNNAEVAGVVQKIALVSKNEGGIVSYDVEIALTEHDPRIRVGMTAEADIAIESVADVVVLPNQYIRQDRVTSETFINLLQPDNTLIEVPVELGLQGTAQSEVISGVKVGDIIGLDTASNILSLFGG